MMTKNRTIYIACLLSALALVVSLLSYMLVHADDTVPVHLTIVSQNETLFSSDISVVPCSVNASSSPVSSGYCALEQSGLPITWSSFGDSQFLDSVSGVGNDYANGFYWGWFSNLEYGQTSLSEHTLSPQEHLLVTLGKMPLKVIVSSTTPEVGTEISVDMQQFGFDASWNPVWLSATSRYSVPIVSTSTFTIVGKKDGFIDSDPVTISPYLAEIATTTPATTTDTTTTGGSGGTTVSDPVCIFNTQKAFDFLISKQKADGSFGSSLYTDWAVVAFAAKPQAGANTKIKNYLTSTPSQTDSVTDSERHAMALEAFGINPYDGTSVNYIKKIVDAFDGEQVGNTQLINDDIFALIPLIKAGYTTDDSVVQKTATNIIAKQKADGSFEGSVDLTASAIQGLSLVQSVSGVTGSLANAKAFLQKQKQSDGGYGSSFSSSWALQALGVPAGAVLCRSQQPDGGMETLDSSETTRIWSTAYALPAVLGKSWADILQSFSKQAVVETQTTPVTPSPIITPIATSSVALFQESTTSSDRVLQKNILVKNSFTQSPVEKGIATTTIALASSIPEKITSNPQVASVVEGSKGVSRFTVIIIVAGVGLLFGLVYVSMFSKSKK